MDTEILLAYAHFIAIIGMVGIVIAETALCRPGLQGMLLHRLKHVDIGYGLLAMAVLATGAMRVMWGAKGYAYYLSNPILHAKVGLFIVAGLLSIVPTVRFIKWSKAAKANVRFMPTPEALTSTRRILALELLALAAIPLLAAMLARGWTGIVWTF